MNQFDIFEANDNTFIVDCEHENNNNKYNFAVFAHFYYTKWFYMYYERLLDIAKGGTKIYITTSNKKLYLIMCEKIKEENIDLNLIINKGRDIGALLIADRKKILSYDYVCFLHDKGAKKWDSESEVEEWNSMLWDNLLGVRRHNDYIKNVLDIFYVNKKLGLLAPPLPYLIDSGITYGDVWSNNYRNTVNLGSSLGIKSAYFDRTKRPMALSTAFWCRVDALSIVFTHKWSLAEMPEEPISDDGEITHAIERIFSFAAQQMGYDTGIIMYAEHAEKICTKMFYDTYAMASIIRDVMMLDDISIYQIRNYKRIISLVEDYKKRYIKLFAYGNGRKFMCYERILNLKGINFDGIIVSNTAESQNDKVISVDDFFKERERNCKEGIVICLGRKFSLEVKLFLENKYNYYDGLYIGLL